jgi:hypothetical protein
MAGNLNEILQGPNIRHSGQVVSEVLAAVDG